MTVDELINELTRIRDNGGGDRIVIVPRDPDELLYNRLERLDLRVSEPYPYNDYDVYSDPPDPDYDRLTPSSDAQPAVLLT